MFDVIDVTSEKVYEDSKSGRDLQIKEDMVENFKSMLDECGFEYNEINIDLLKKFVDNFNDSSLSKGELYAYGGWTSIVLFSDYTYALECFEKLKEYDEVSYYWFMGKLEDLRGNRSIAVDLFEKLTLTDAYNNDQKEYFDIFGAAEEKLADYYFDNNNRKLSSAFAERAAKHGNLDAMFGIAINSFYKNKIYDINIKPKEGFDIIKRLADEFNDKNACGFLASAYFAGFIPSKNNLLIDGKEFLSQDYQKCVYYAEKYIRNKDICRLHRDMDVKAMLGHCYTYGLGVKQNLNIAEEYLNEALSYDENNVFVLKDMVWLYIKRGETNPSDQNKEKCLYWLKRAADLGDEEAKDALKNIKSSDGCYIATCIYGSYDCSQVWVLRRFRDFFLRRFALGEFFIRYYYKISPMIVDIFGGCYLFRFVSRKILDFMVLWLKNRGYSDKPYND